MASFTHTLLAPHRHLLRVWLLACVAFVAGLLLTHVNSGSAWPQNNPFTFKPSHASASKTGHANTHAVASASNTHAQHCQNKQDTACQAPQHHSNDCLWQCLLVCMAHVLLFALCLVCGLKTRLLAYAKLPLCFKSSSLKRLLKPPKNSMVCA